MSSVRKLVIGPLMPVNSFVIQFTRPGRVSTAEKPQVEGQSPRLNP